MVRNPQPSTLPIFQLPRSCQSTATNLRNSYSHNHREANGISNHERVVMPGLCDNPISMRIFKDCLPEFQEQCRPLLNPLISHIEESANQTRSAEIAKAKRYCNSQALPSTLGLVFIMLICAPACQHTSQPGRVVVVELVVLLVVLASKIQNSMLYLYTFEPL